MTKPRTNRRIIAFVICAFAITMSLHSEARDPRLLAAENGLDSPSSTYIGAGTMSASAKGSDQNGQRPNANLPKVPWGATVGTPGDRTATGGVSGNSASSAGRSTLPTSSWGASIGTAGDRIRSDLNPQYYQNNENNRARFRRPTQVKPVTPKAEPKAATYDKVTTGGY
ncbi:MAG: hypothetical protein JST89_06145 [Cyanobacteria bacterium SZAS-4]|nr:hypothetical protein [Cyanobacteria bacterium SZAS-4]